MCYFVLDDRYSSKTKQICEFLWLSSYQIKTYIKSSTYLHSALLLVLQYQTVNRYTSLKVQSNLALREIFVTAYLSLKVKFLLKSSFRNIISEPYISPTEKRKPFFSLSLSFPTAFNLPNSQYIQQMIIDKCILSKTTIGQV